MRLRLNLQICRYVNSSGEKLTYKFLFSHQDAVRFFPRYYSKSVCCSINEHTMQLKTFIFPASLRHHWCQLHNFSLYSPLNSQNQLQDIIQHRVSVIEKIQLVQLYKEAVKLYLVHQSSFWPSMVPWLSLGELDTSVRCQDHRLRPRNNRIFRNNRFPKWEAPRAHLAHRHYIWWIMECHEEYLENNSQSI